MKVFIEKLAAQGLFLVAQNEGLVLRSRNGELTEEQVTQIRNDKSITTFIQENKDELLQEVKNQKVASRFYKLSPLQEGILFHHLFDKNSKAYVEQLRLDFPEGVDIEILKKSLNYVIGNYSILRTNFIYDQAKIPVQCVFDQVKLPLELLDYSKLSSAEKAKRFTEFLEIDVQRSFDMQVAPLMRLTLVDMGDNFFKMVWTSHHILLDGWSMSIVMAEVIDAYETYASGETPVIKQEDKYEDFIKYIAQRDQYEEELFWKSYLKNFSENTLLPFVHTAGSHNTGAGIAKKYLDLTDEFTNTLKAYCQQNQLTVNTLLQGVWSLILSKYTGKDKVVFGVPVSGRPSDLANAEQRVGLYLNTLPLFVELAQDAQIEDWLRAIQQNNIEAREFQHTALNKIQQWIGTQGDFFDSILVFENYPIRKAISGSDSRLKIENVVLEEQSNYLLNISVVLEGTLQVIFRYNEELMDASYVEGMKGHFFQLLNQIVEGQASTIAELELLTTTEKHQLLQTFNNTEVNYPTDQTPIDLFREQVQKSADQIAVSFEKQRLSYKDLDEQSDKLAKYLKDQVSISSGDLVGIMMHPSTYTIISILGVLKAGAAYVPMALDDPASRRQFIVKDTNIKALIIEMENLFDVTGLEVEAIAIDILLDEFEDATPADQVKIKPDQLAYVLYTSGSTGVPKGVQVGHGSLMNYVNYGLEKYGTGDQALSFPYFTPLTFDLTQTSILLTLLSGGTLFIPAGLEVADQIQQILSNEDINALKLTPSHVGLIDAEDSTHISTFILGGEALLPAQVEKLHTISPLARVYNEYGPTEATIGCSVWEAPKEAEDNVSILIGKPIANTQIYILGQSDELLPVGVIGELCIGGAGLAQGYWNRADLTASKFITLTIDADTTVKLYKSGDLARWLPDGQLELIGRKDDQVKIRGHRIELGEVEHRIREYEHVEDAVVVCREREEIGKELIVYYLPATPNFYTTRKILEHKDREIADNIQLFTLPNGMQMYSYNKFEIEFVYDEIFNNNVYFKHGINIPDGGVVVDIGANSGMFSILAGQVANEVQIYAYEPLPPTYEILKLNTDLYPGNYNLHNWGISDKEEKAVFTHYPNATVLSTRSASHAEVTETVKQFILNSEGYAEDQLDEEELNALLEEKLVTQQFECTLKTVSQIIAENELSQIDYLKIDVEDAEWAVLEGIKMEDWPKIRQLVIEVHDVKGRLAAIKKLLANLGFEVWVHQSSDAQNTSLYDLYAIASSVVAEHMVATPPVVDPNSLDFPGLEELRKGLRNYLSERLPDYMVPALMVEMGRFQLTRNGKIDKKALPDPDASELTTHQYVAPGNEIETQLADIWKDLLKVERVGILDDFFELGGHSLIATRVVSTIKKRFGVELGVNDLFAYTTVETLARLIERKDKGQELPSVEYIAEKPSNIPLSFAQERLWFIDKLTGSTHYHLPYVQVFNTDLDIQVLRYALNEIINRHEVLRTVLWEEDGIAFQRVLPKDTWSLEFTQSETAEIPTNLDALIEAEVYRPFDLAKDHLIRAKVIQFADNGYVLIATMHHIASDGWSSGLLLSEFVELYRSKKEERTPFLPTLEVQYADYALWQRAHLKGKSLEDKLDYWEHKLAGVEPLSFPTDYPRPLIHSLKGDSHDFVLDKTISLRLKEIANEEGISLFMLLLAAYKVLLYRYSGQTDICVGTTIANRPQKDLESLIGYFVNTLALRTNLQNNPDFAEVLSRVKATTLEAYQHVSVPFEKVVGRVDKERDQRISSLFQVLFVMDNNPNSLDEGLSDLVVQTEAFHFKIAKFDLTFFVTETGEGLRFSINYCTDLFVPETIIRLKEHFTQLLKSVAKNHHQPIAELELLKSAEKTQLLTTFNQHEVSYNADRTIIDLFEEQLLKTPDVIAYSFGETRMTYRELAEKATRLAYYLRYNYKLEPNDLVGIMMENSAWSIPAILGVLKAGAGYVPIDKDLPASSKKFIIQDTQLKALIIESESLFEVVDIDLPIFAIDIQLEEAIALQTNGTLLPEVNSNDLAYVIYTSGTTGQPKGVMISHKNVVDYYLGLDAKVDLKNNQSFGLMSSLAADLGNTVLFGALFSGGTLHLFSKQLLMNADLLQDYFRQFPIDCIKIVPSHWQALTVDGELLLPKRMIIFGGEVLPPQSVEKIKSKLPELKVINHYGPTETTIGKLLHQVDMSAQYTSIPLGRPFSNTQLYVVNQDLALCPVGVPGELLIGGDGIAKGYINNEALTAEKFIANPFDPNNANKLYRTGDLVQWLPNGNIAYLGRTDDQLKIRGYRVELNGITKVLVGCDQVQQGIVVAKADDYGNKRLVAYVCPKGLFDKEGILNSLKEQLPDYMIPSQVIQLEALPLTANGKVDKKALPDPEDLDKATKNYVAAATELEAQLVEIWTHLLHIGNIGIHDNFFELGGDSIIAIQLVSRVKRIGYHMQVQDLFEYSTIAELAAHIEQTSTGDGIIAEQETLTGAAPLTPIQHWFFEQPNTQQSHFNQAILLQVEKGIQEENLQKVFQLLLERHDALRFTYTSELAHIFANKRQWIQTYGTANAALEIVDCPETKAGNLATCITDICEQYQTQLDIEKGRLANFVLIRTPQTESHNRLFLVIHHLAIDGVSWRILMDEMEVLLDQLQRGDALDVGSKTSSYRAWGEALTHYAETEKVEAQQAYWQSIKNAYRALPTDFQPENIQRADLKQVSITLDSSLTKALLNEVNHAFNTEINDLLLSALAQTIGTWTGENQIVIGLEGHGREALFEAIDISNTVGWFTNKYPVRLELEATMEEGSLIKSIKEQLRSIPEKGMGYGCLKYLHPSSNIRTELSGKAWDIVFNYLGQFDNSTNNSTRFSLANETPGTSVSPDTEVDHNLEIIGAVSEGQLSLTWHYSGKAFKETTIQELANQYKSNLTHLVQFCKDRKTTEATPSDFGLNGDLSYQELDSLFGTNGVDDEDGVMKF
ncbi:MAG: hypothetical protein DHS20C18_22790 [Saprospiraceae bacterium]|nr:MAG: hypothetical protein DHS20C18_22790 [Saprospiraceae bacterium]